MLTTICFLFSLAVTCVIASRTDPSNRTHRDEIAAAVAGLAVSLGLAFLLAGQLATAAAQEAVQYLHPIRRAAAYIAAYDYWGALAPAAGISGFGWLLGLFAGLYWAKTKAAAVKAGGAVATHAGPHVADGAKKALGLVVRYLVVFGLVGGVLAVVWHFFGAWIMLGALVVILLGGWKLFAKLFGIMLEGIFDHEMFKAALGHKSGDAKKKKERAERLATWVVEDEQTAHDAEDAARRALQVANAADEEAQDARRRRDPQYEDLRDEALRLRRAADNRAQEAQRARDAARRARRDADAAAAEAA